MWSTLAEAIKRLPPQNNPDSKPTTIPGFDYTTHGHLYDNPDGTHTMVRCISRQAECNGIRLIGMMNTAEHDAR
jgi:hypothetical protein